MVVEIWLLAHILEEQGAVNSNFNWDQIIIPKCLAKSQFLTAPQVSAI